MLTEFLLTPDAISDSDGRNGSDVVRDLQHCLFPFAAVPAALVCKLGGEDWTRAVANKIARIRDVNHRLLAQSLFTQITEHLCVARPAVHRGGDEEAHWISAGTQSSNRVQLDGIVVSSQSEAPANAGVRLSQFMRPEYWAPYSNPRLVGRDLAAQRQVLRAICAHSDWLIIRLPQIRGGSDDEIVTVKQAIEMSTQLPPGYARSDIHLHLCSMPRIDAARLMRGVSGELRPLTRNGVNITLTLWPENHFRNREIIGGEYVTTSAQTKVRKARWWLTMTHVAVGSRTANAAGESGNTWGLFSRDKAHAHLEELTSQQPIQTITVT